MSVDAENPGRGDVAGILAAARERSMKAAAMRDAERELQAAIAGVTPDVWAGEAAAAFVTAARSSARIAPTRPTMTISAESTAVRVR